jgi:hypothetical protein
MSCGEHDGEASTISRFGSEFQGGKPAGIVEDSIEKFGMKIA